MIEMTGEQFVCKILQGERDLSGVEIPIGTDLSKIQGYAEMNDYLKRQALDKSPIILKYSNLEGVRASNLWLPHTLATGVQLYRARLERVNFKGARLDGANFLEAELFEADFSGADLREADLRCAYMGRANIRGADLRRASFYNATLKDTDLREADLRGSTIWMAAHKTNAKYKGAIIDTFLNIMGVFAPRTLAKMIVREEETKPKRATSKPRAKVSR